MWRQMMVAVLLAGLCVLPAKAEAVYPACVATYSDDIRIYTNYDTPWYGVVSWTLPVAPAGTPPTVEPSAASCAISFQFVLFGSTAKLKAYSIGSPATVTCTQSDWHVTCEGTVGNNAALDVVLQGLTDVGIGDATLTDISNHTSHHYWISAWQRTILPIISSN